MNTNESKNKNTSDNIYNKNKLKSLISSNDIKFKLLKNFKNYQLLIPKSNCQNRLDSIVNFTEEYVKKISYLDPTDPNYELFNLKSCYLSRIMAKEKGEKYFQKKLETKKNLPPISKIVNSNNNFRKVKINSNNKNNNNIRSNTYNKKRNTVESKRKINLEDKNNSPIKGVFINNSSNNINQYNTLSPIKLKDKSDLNNKEIFNMEKIVSELKAKNTSYLNKLNNITTEKNLEEKIKKLNNENLNFKENIDKTQKSINNLNIDISDAKSQISVINIKKDKLNKNYQKLISNNIFDDPTSNVVLIHKAENNEIIKANTFVYETKLKEYQSEIEYIQTNIIFNKTEEISNIKSSLENILTKLNKNCDEIKSIKKKLIVHYHKILIEGTDTRSEGLSWVILAIWNIGYDVIIEYFPDYLDKYCIDYLFSIAKKKIELIDIEDNLLQLREMLKISRQKAFKSGLYNNIINNLKKQGVLNSFDGCNICQKNSNNLLNLPNLNETFKTEVTKSNNILDKKNKQILNSSNNLLFNKISSFKNKNNFKGISTKDTINFKNNMKILKKHLCDIRENSNYYNTINKIEKNILGTHIIDSYSDSIIKNINNLENNKKQIIKNLEIDKNKELDRIYKEYLYYDYGLRFNVKIESVISALVGNDYSNYEIIKLINNEKKLQDKINLISLNNN